MVIVGPPNPEGEKPPQPRRQEVNLTFLESLPDWRIFSRFGKMASGSLRRASVYYWLIVSVILGSLIVGFAVSEKTNPIDNVIFVLIATFLTVTLVYWGIARVALWISDLMEKKENRIGQMHKGVRRILYCINIGLVVVFSILFLWNTSPPRENPALNCLLILFSIAIGATTLLWALVRVCLWVIDGFEEEKEKKQKGANTKQ